MGLVNLRPPTTIFIQATSDIKRKVNARARRRSRALTGARAPSPSPSPAHARALSVFFAQRCMKKAFVDKFKSNFLLPIF